MEVVAKHLVDQQWGEALVRLWAIARDPAVLNNWERARKTDGFEDREQEILRRLDAGETLTVDECHAAPLELIRAVDRLLWDEMASTKFSRHSYNDAKSGLEFWLWRVGTSGRSRTPLAKQAGSRANWFRYHVIAPTAAGGIEIHVEMAEGTLATRSTALAAVKRPEVRIWIGHFDDGCHVIWDPSRSSAGRVRATAIDNAAERSDSITSTLEHALDTSAHVVLMPEMSVDLQMRSDVTEWLTRNASTDTPFMVVPGSFHETIGADCYNTAPLLDGFTGDVLFAHRKLRVFGRVGHGLDTDGAEDIAIGSRFHVLVTELGTFAVLICKDFLDADKQVATLLQEVPVDWILVPSYGDEGTLNTHTVKADEIARKTVGCNVALANIRNVGITNGAALPGFVHIQGSKEVSPVGPAGGVVAVAIDRPKQPTASPAPSELGKRALAVQPALKRIK